MVLGRAVESLLEATYSIRLRSELTPGVIEERIQEILGRYLKDKIL